MIDQPRSVLNLLKSITERGASTTIFTEVHLSNMLITANTNTYHSIQSQRGTAIIASD
jgi:hypothetical protein